MLRSIATVVWSATAIEHGSRTGYFFGTTSGVITTAGLMVGLAAGTDSLLAVLGGIFVIAVSDAMSDALGIHLALEADPNTASHHVWTAMFATFVAKFVVSASFAVPLLLFPLGTGVIVALVWGLAILTALSWQLARMQGTAPLLVVLEHVAIATLVVALSHGVGIWVRNTFA
jgi:vacuolar iron transporter family protein